jgi:hypothetical protein
MAEGAATGLLSGPEEWVWPFSAADLTAGLRRYVEDNSLQITSLAASTLSHRRPAIGRITGLEVGYSGDRGHGSLKLVVKEPRGTTRTGLAGAGRREVGFYSSLASQIPMLTPGLVAFSREGDWIVLEYLESAREPPSWTRSDYDRSIESLVGLHDRFWALTEDLGAFFWLSDPVGADYEVHVAAAGKAIQDMIEVGRPRALAGSPERVALLTRLTREAERVVKPLRSEPGTLLHGDYWPGNIAILPSQAQVVYDWQLAGVGPAVMDLLVLINKTDWWFGPLGEERQRLIDYYRARLEARCGVAWEDAEWEMLWDHALMWRFLQEWLDLLAATPEALLATRADQLDTVWLAPLKAAVDRRLGSAQ